MGTALLILAVLGAIGALVWWLIVQKNERENRALRMAANAKKRADAKVAADRAKRTK